MDAMEFVVEKQLKSLLLDEDPTKIEFLHQKMMWNNWANGRQGMVMGAISGIDVALWDILGKVANLPVCKLLGQVSDKVQGYASAGFYAKGKTLEDLQKEIEGYLDRGFTAFKMKIGRTANNYKMRLQYMKNGDFYLTGEEDKARIELVRRTIGPDKTLMVDMNCTWDVDDVLRSKEFFEKNDIHIHIPEGAVPKDGPSAGVTMATAMLSAITGTPVRADVAMTGEITLRGRVLPIGGLREKSIAAKVAGIHTVIVPEKNRRDIRELDKEITKDMKFVYASTMADILPVALESMPKAQAANS